MKKKIIYGLGSSLVTVIPMVAVVSCGGASESATVEKTNEVEVIKTPPVIPTTDDNSGTDVMSQGTNEVEVIKTPPVIPTIDDNGETSSEKVEVKKLPDVAVKKNYLDELKKFEDNPDYEYFVEEYDYSDLEKNRFVQSRTEASKPTTILALMVKNDKPFWTLNAIENFRTSIERNYASKIIYLIIEDRGDSYAWEAQTIDINAEGHRRMTEKLDGLRDKMMSFHNFRQDNRRMPLDKAKARNTILYMGNKLVFDQFRDREMFPKQQLSWYLPSGDSNPLNQFYDYQFAFIKNVLQSTRGKQLSFGISFGQNFTRKSYTVLDFIVPEKAPNNFTELFEFIKTVKKDGLVAHSNAEQMYEAIDNV